MRMGRLNFLVIISVFVLNACSKDSGDFSMKEPSGNTTVYICKGAYSKSYHFDSECEGLRSCSTKIFETDLKSAQQKGRALCGYEQ